jgi:hypothetical protein
MFYPRGKKHRIPDPDPQHWLKISGHRPIKNLSVVQCRYIRYNSGRNVENQGYKSPVYGFGRLKAAKQFFFYVLSIVGSWHRWLVLVGGKKWGCAAVFTCCSRYGTGTDGN